MLVTFYFYKKHFLVNFQSIKYSDLIIENFQNQYN